MFRSLSLMKGNDLFDDPSGIQNITSLDLVIFFGIRSNYSEVKGKKTEPKLKVSFNHMSYKILNLENGKKI